MGGFLFSECTSLREITIPQFVSIIGYYAFDNCTSLESVYCKPANVPKAEYKTNSVDYWSAFDGNAPERKIYVPTTAVESYKQADFWSDYAEDIVDGGF